MGLEAVLIVCTTTVVGDRERQEVILEVGMGSARMTANEGARLEVVGRPMAAMEQEPFEPHAEPAEWPRRSMQRHRLRTKSRALDFVLYAE